MEEQILNFLRYVDGKAVSFSGVLKVCNLHLSPMDEKKLKKYLLDHDLIKLTEPEGETFGPQLRYTTTDHGKEIVNEISFVESLDKLLNYYLKDFNLNGNKASGHSVEEVCKHIDIEYSKAYDAYIHLLGFMESRPNKEGNAYNIIPTTMSTKQLDKGNYFLNTYRQEFFKEHPMDISSQRTQQQISEQEEHLHLYERILLFLDEKGRAQPNVYQSLNDEFPEVEHKILKEVSNDLRTKGEIMVKPSTSFGSQVFYAVGSDKRDREFDDYRNSRPKPQEPRKPEPVMAYILISGIQQAKAIRNNSTIPTPIFMQDNSTRTHNEDYRIMNVKAENIGTVGDSKNQKIESSFNARPKATSKTFWEKYGDTAKIITGIGAIAGLITFLLTYFL
jgi:hypothetical protein